MSKFPVYTLTSDRLIQLAFDVHPDGFDSSEFDPLAERISLFWNDAVKEAILLTSVSSHYDNYVAFWGALETHAFFLAREGSLNLHKMWSEVLVKGAKNGLSAKGYGPFVRVTIGELMRFFMPKKPNFAGGRDVYLPIGPLSETSLRMN